MSNIEFGGFPELTVEQDFSFQINIILNSSKCKWIVSSHLPGASFRGHTYPLSNGRTVTLSQARNIANPDNLSNTMIVAAEGENIADGDFIEWSSEGAELSSSGEEVVGKVMSILEDLQRQRSHPNGDYGGW